MRKTASVEFKLICCRRVSVDVYVCRSVAVTVAICMQGHRLRIRDEKAQIGLVFPDQPKIWLWQLATFWATLVCILSSESCWFWPTFRLQNAEWTDFLIKIRWHSKIRNFSWISKIYNVLIPNVPGGISFRRHLEDTLFRPTFTLSFAGHWPSFSSIEWCPACPCSVIRAATGQWQLVWAAVINWL